MGKSTVSMASFNSYVKLPEGKITVMDFWLLLHLNHENFGVAAHGATPKPP
jgi:hypothetical protein